MKLHIQYIDGSLEPGIEERIREAISKLESKYNWIEATEFTIRQEKNEKEDNNLVEIRMLVPGKDLFCDSRNEKIDLAISRALDKIRRLLEDKKDRDFSHPRHTPL